MGNFDKKVFILLVLSWRVFGADIGLLKGRPFLFYLSGNVALTSTESDKAAGAIYSRNMRTPLIAVAGIGWHVIPPFCLGVRYENWFSARTLTLNGDVQTDTLKLQMLGPELAYARGNPRVQYLFALGGMYPLEKKINSTKNGTFQQGAQFWNYHARAAIELRFNSRLGLHLEAGYRWVNLRDLQSSGSSFLPGGTDLNLSGPFLGLGFVSFF